MTEACAMRHSRKRRRVYRWEGCVDEIDGGSLYVRLIPADHEGPETVAEIDRSHLPDAQPGTFFNIYSHTRGKKRRIVIRERVIRTWTEAELAEVRARAAQEAAELAEMLA